MLDDGHIRHECSCHGHGLTAYRKHRDALEEAAYVPPPPREQSAFVKDLWNIKVRHTYNFISPRGQFCSCHPDDWNGHLQDEWRRAYRHIRTMTTWRLGCMMRCGSTWHRSPRRHLEAWAVHLAAKAGVNLLWRIRETREPEPMMVRGIP